MEQDNTILIVTHGNIGKELLDSASMFIKIEQQVHVIGLYADDDINDVHKKVENFLFIILKLILILVFIKIINLLD